MCGLVSLELTQLSIQLLSFHTFHLSPLCDLSHILLLSLEFGAQNFDLGSQLLLELHLLHRLRVQSFQIHTELLKRVLDFVNTLTELHTNRVLILDLTYQHFLRTRLLSKICGKLTLDLGFRGNIVHESVVRILLILKTFLQLDLLLLVNFLLCLDLVLRVTILLHHVGIFHVQRLFLDTEIFQVMFHRDTLNLSTLRLSQLLVLHVLRVLK